MPRNEGDPPDQHVLDVRERMPPRGALLKRTLQTIGVPEPDVTAAIFTKRGFSVTPVEASPRQVVPKGSAQKLPPSETRSEPRASYLLGIEGALWRSKDAVLLPFRGFLSITSDTLWRPIGVICLSIVRSYLLRALLGTIKAIFFGGALVGVIVLGADPPAAPEVYSPITNPDSFPSVLTKDWPKVDESGSLAASDGAESKAKTQRAKPRTEESALGEAVGDLFRALDPFSTKK